MSHRKGQGLEVCAWRAETNADEAAIIAETVKSLHQRGYRYGDIAVLLRSVRTSGEVIVEAFRKRRIPFVCSGRTGLFRQPEALVLGKTYAWIVGNPWKMERYGDKQPVVYAELLQEYRDVFGLKSATVDKLNQYLRAWKRDAEDERKAANLVRDYYRLLRLLGVHRWDLADSTMGARMGSLARFSELLADFEHVNRRTRLTKENGNSVLKAGNNRGLWYYRDLFNYLQYYALDAYEDFPGEDNLELDAVDITTVHQAKGLEWSVVFVPCLVVDRFPSKMTGTEQEWLLPKRAFSEKTRRRYEGSETDERRLFYVAITRAKDMLYLSGFERMKVTRKPSPLLLDVAGQVPQVLDNLQAHLPPHQEETNETAFDDKPTLTFSELADYESCPLNYRLSNLLGFQPQLAPEFGYGRAIHHVLRRLADHVRFKQRLPSGTELAKIFAEEFYLPFAGKAAYEELLKAANLLVDRYLNQYSDDLFRVWETERAFELHLEKGIVAGRADVILYGEHGQPSSMALVDYKTSTDPRSDDIYAFQLAIYTAAGRGDGIDVRAAYAQDLTLGDRRAVPIDGEKIAAVKKRTDRLVDGIAARRFGPNPERAKCGRCDVRFVCKHGSAR